ncbi:MAG: ribonuclease HII [Oscillospiraceae bacterium]|nr:ribonuclease HII [Oscillospiraceae bacterium]
MKKTDTPSPDLFLFDAESFPEAKHLCGADEAGRGPLAGPVFAAAVILDPYKPIAGINDSKKLTEKKRELLFDEITEKALAYSIQMISPEEIDEINILAASMKAMKLSVEALDITPDMVIVDGNKTPALALPVQAIVKGDAKSACIAAASVLAKVSRDRYMMEMHQKYPQYCFDKHKGYPTKLHYEMIAEHGISEIHRKTFLKTLDKHI